MQNIINAIVQLKLLNNVPNYNVYDNTLSVLQSILTEQTLIYVDNFLGKLTKDELSKVLDGEESDIDFFYRIKFPTEDTHIVNFAITVMFHNMH
jgi:hypothetical protein